MLSVPYIALAEELEHAGLVWQPEIGDEIAPRIKKGVVSILVDPEGMSPKQLRQTYLWLPTAEQIIYQFEARQAILYHAGLELSEEEVVYKTVIRHAHGVIESAAENFRTSLGYALKHLLTGKNDESLH